MNEDPVRSSSFCSQTGVDPSPDGGGGGGGIYVKYWPSGGWAFTHTGALTHENTVYREFKIIPYGLSDNERSSKLYIASSSWCLTK